MSVLPDWEIESLALEGAIDPYNPEQLQPSTYDVRLSNTFQRFRGVWDNDCPPRIIDPYNQECLDSLMTPVTAEEGQVVLLKPREFMLGSTMEVVNIPENLVCRLEGKSSLGRLGLAVHVTAGYIDPGFQGSITLEMLNLADRPILLRPGMPIAQIGFHFLSAPPRTTYTGRYQGDKIATPSRYGVRRTKECL